MITAQTSNQPIDPVQTQNNNLGPVQADNSPNLATVSKIWKKEVENKSHNDLDKDAKPMITNADKQKKLSKPKLISFIAPLLKMTVGTVGIILTSPLMLTMGTICGLAGAFFGGKLGGEASFWVGLGGAMVGMHFGSLGAVSLFTAGLNEFNNLKAKC